MDRYPFVTAIELLASKCTLRIETGTLESGR